MEASEKSLILNSFQHFYWNGSGMVTLGDREIKNGSFKVLYWSYLGVMYPVQAVSAQ